MLMVRILKLDCCLCKMSSPHLTDCSSLCLGLPVSSAASGPAWYPPDPEAVYVITRARQPSYLGRRIPKT